jgi:hypothetical protein
MLPMVKKILGFFEGLEIGVGMDPMNLNSKF